MDNKDINKEEEIDFLKRINISSINVENRPFNIEELLERTKDNIAP